MAEDKKKSKDQKAEAGEKKPTAAKKSASDKKAASKKEASKKPAAKKPATKKKPSGKTVVVTQIGSPIGRQAYQRATLIGLGLDKMHKTSELQDTPAVRGMIEKVKHLVRVEDAA